MDNQLALEYQIISLEARGGRDSLDLFHERLPKFIANVKDFLSSTLGRLAPRPDLVKLSPMQKALEQVGYSRATSLKVYTPTGLDVTYVEYLDALEQSQDAIDSLEKGLLLPFSKWISLLLSEPKELSSLRPNNIPKGVTFSDIDGIKRRIGECFDNRKGKSEQSFGDVFSRLKDVELTERKTNGIIERLAKVNRRDLASQVEALSSLISKLVRRIEEEEEGYSLSNQTIQQLSNLVYQVAVEVEHYSVYVHSVEALTNALNDTNEFVVKALK